MLFSFNKLLNSVFSCQCDGCVIVVLLYMQDCILLQLTLGWICVVSRYCVEEHMMSARYRFQHLASLVFRHGPDVGLMSFPMSSLSDIGLMSARYRFRHQTSVVFRHRPDVGLISLTTSGRHRAHVQTWSRPDISRHLPISARYILPTSGCCRGRHLPISGRHRASMVFRNRPDIESISARCRPDIVDDIWPISARYILPTSDLSIMCRVYLYIGVHDL